MTTDTPGASADADPRGGTADDPAAARLSLRGFLGELVLGGIVATLVSLVVQFAANRINMKPGTYLPDALISLATATILLVLFAVLAYRWGYRLGSWAKSLGAWVALSALSTIVLAVSLQGTRFFLGGTKTDNTFRLQYMERMASSASLADVNYHDLAPYYPGGWFWLGGRFANLFGMDGWAAYKPYAITWVALTAVVAFVLWSLVLRRRIALLAAVATVLSGFMSVGVEEPYAWPSAAWLPPIAVLAWTQLRRRSSASTWLLVLIGCYLGFAAVTYTLHFGFAVLLVLVLAVAAGVVDVRGGEDRGVLVRRLVYRLVVIGVVALVIAAVNWAPFVLAGGLGKPNLAARYLPSDSAYFPMPFGPGSVFAVLCAIGLVWMLVRFRKDDIATALLATGALVYVWFALSTVALALQTTLLAFRFLVVINVVLMVAGTLGAVELIRYARSRAREQASTVVTVGFALAMVGAVTITQTSFGTALSEPVDLAESSYYPDGSNAKGDRNPAKPGAWSGKLISTIDELSEREATQNIVLSTVDQPMLFRPYWGFQQTTPQYANPLARFNDRADEIRTWAASATPDQFFERLSDGPFEPPNTFLLRRVAGGSKLEFNIRSDSFPRASPVREEPVYFDAKVFNSERFVSRDVGPYRVISLR